MRMMKERKESRTSLTEIMDCCIPIWEDLEEGETNSLKILLYSIGNYINIL